MHHCIRINDIDTHSLHLGSKALIHCVFEDSLMELRKAVETIYDMLFDRLAYSQDLGLTIYLEPIEISCHFGKLTLKLDELLDVLLASQKVG